MSSVDAVSPIWSSQIADYPTAIKASPDGQYLAIGGGSGRLDVLRLADGATVASEQAHKGGLLCMAWHPTRLCLATGGQEPSVRFWRVLEKEVVELFQAGKGWVEHLAFSPSGDRLAVAAGCHVYIRDVGADTVVVTPAHKSSVSGLAWRPDGRQVVTACYGGIQQIEAKHAAVKRRLPWKGAMVTLALSPDGRVVACGCQDDSVHFWRLANGQNARMSGYSAKPTRLSWRADGHWLATNGGNDVVLWNFSGRGPEGSSAELLHGHEGRVTAVAFAPQGGGLVSGGQDGRVLFWLPGRSASPVAAGRMTAAVVDLLWAFRGEHIYICAADADGRVLCWSM